MHTYYTIKSRKEPQTIDNKMITLPLWSGYVQIYVVLFVLKKSEERKQIYGKKTSVG